MASQMRTSCSTIGSIPQFRLLVLWLILIWSAVSQGDPRCGGKDGTDSSSCQVNVDLNVTNRVIYNLSSKLSKNNPVRNELLQRKNGDCPKVGLIFVRGTSEPGNVGLLAGPPFFEKLTSYLNDKNDLAIQGIDYPADVNGFLVGGSKIGTSRMMKIVTDTIADCPSINILVSGYSQGAQVVHKAVDQLPSDTNSKIGGVILFGDPRNGKALKDIDSDKVKTFCHVDDTICKGLAVISSGHLTYSLNAKEAAMFAMARISN